MDVMGYGNLSSSGYNIDASSIHIYRTETHDLGSGVTLFAVKDYNKECGPDCAKNFSCPCGNHCDPEGPVIVSWLPGKCWGGGSYKDVEVTLPGAQGNSILIDPDRLYMAVLFEEENFNSNCQVFTASDTFLEDEYISRCDAPGLFTGNEACFSAIIVKPVELAEEE
jgi:hypothetical protein